MISIDRELHRACCFDDIASLARRRLPRVVFDFIDGAAGGEQTMRANRVAFEQVTLRPRQGNAPVTTDISVRILGDTLRMPIMLGPCGSARIIHPDGEMGIARAAEQAGTVFVVPHHGGTRCADLRQGSSGALWYQIYRYGGRKVAEPAVRRAWSAGYRTLVVNIENGGTLKERDARNGLRPLLGKNRFKALPYMGQLFARPEWLFRFLSTRQATAMPNALLPDGRAMEPRDSDADTKQEENYFRWADFEWLRDAWPGPIVAKGILSASDARRAVDCGAKGLIVSNHGGRMQDGLDATMRVLPEVVASVPSDIPVLLDSGVRRGADVIKAMCLGARAVLIGKPYMLALSCGEAGVTRLLALLEDDLRQNLWALGCASVAELSQEFVRTPAEWG